MKRKLHLISKSAVNVRLREGLMTENKYFAASNTVKGFVSYYKEIFGTCESVYVIKGGSGTGKGRFMRECANHAINSGRANNIEYFYCSFDPDSLDGIIIDGRIAVIDGTAPHVYEPTLAGAHENLVDLGAFWDPSKLRTHKDKLLELQAQKRAHFSRAYKYLAAYGELDGVVRDVVSASIDMDRASSYASKLVSELNCGGSADQRLRLDSAIGRNGMVRLNGYESSARTNLRLFDSMGIAPTLLESIFAEAKRFSMPTTFSYSPLFEGRLNALKIGDQLSLTLCQDGDKADLDTRDFLRSDPSGEVAAIKKYQADMLEMATEEFSKAGKVHFRIEDIYIDAMDFGRKEEYTARFLKEMQF